METLKELVAHYQARQLKLWLITSGSLFFLSIFLLSFISIQKINYYFLVKKDHIRLTQEVAALKSSLSSGRKLVQKYKLLRKQQTLFIKKSRHDLLKAVSAAIPSETYLTDIILTTTMSLKGYAPDMHELAQFVSALSTSLFDEVSIKESHLEAEGVRFELTAIPKTQVSRTH